MVVTPGNYQGYPDEQLSQREIRDYQIAFSGESFNWLEEE